MRKVFLVVIFAGGGVVISIALSKSIWQAQAQSPSAQMQSNTPQTKESEQNQKLGYFDYADEAHGIRARVYLPEALGEWAVENPWRDSTKSLTKEPQIFVKVNF